MSNRATPGTRRGFWTVRNPGRLIVRGGVRAGGRRADDLLQHRPTELGPISDALWEQFPRVSSINVCH